MHVPDCGVLSSIVHKIDIPLVMFASAFDYAPALGISPAADSCPPVVDAAL